MVNERYKVWTCSVIVPGDSKLPEKPDQIPRLAVLKAMKEMNLSVLFLNAHWEDGEVHHGDEDEILDSLTPDVPEINVDEPTDYESLSRGY